MSIPDFGDVQYEAAGDQDIRTLLAALKTALSKYGAFATMRIVASVMAPYKRQRFEQMLEVKESRAMVAGLPSDLAGKEVDPNTVPRDMGLKHDILWQRGGKPRYLTSEPYYIKKEQLKELIAYCDEYGIDFQIDAESCYYPGGTVRILFKKGTVTRYDALQQRTGEKG